MKHLKKLWSVTAICGMLIGILPLSIFAATIEAADVVINQATITDTEDQEITESNRVKHKATVKTKLSWSLTQPTLIEENTLLSINLPANLNYPDQSGSLGEMGNYQVSNQQLIFQFNKNYQATEDGRAPDFASAKFYEGVLELTAETTSEDLETETVDFGNNLVSTLYYDKKVDPAADPLEVQEAVAEKIQPQAHNPNLNERLEQFFTNIKITDLEGNAFTEENPAVKDANILIHFDWALANEEDIKAGDTYTYQLPDYFSIHNPVNGILKNGENGPTLGSFVLNEQGLLTVIFNGEGEMLSDRSGTIDLKTELKIETEEETVSIEMPLKEEDNQKITIILPVAKADIRKEGLVKDKSVNWTIYANEERLNLKNAKITDDLPEGLKFAYAEYFILNDQNNWVAPPSGFIKEAHHNDIRRYEFTFPTSAETGMNVPVKIIIHTTIESKDITSFKNKVKIEGSNFNTNLAEASVTVEEKRNSKNLSSYDLAKGILNWKAKATFDGENGLFRDWMYDKVKPETAVHYLKKDTLVVTDENGTALTEGTDYTFSLENKDYAMKDGEYVYFTLKFKNPGVYHITYQSEAFEKPLKPNSFIMNYAEVTDNGKTEYFSGNEQIKTDGRLGVKKTSPSIDYTNSEIEYKIDINTEKIKMINGVITDRFQNLSGSYKSAQQLLPETLLLKTKGGTELKAGDDYELVELPDCPAYKGGFRIKLEGAFSETEETLVLTYKVRYFLDEQDKDANGLASKRFDNSVIVSFTGEDEKEYIDGAELAVWLSDPIVHNGYKYGMYIPKDGDVTQKLDMNGLNPYDEPKAPTDSVYWSAVFNTWNTTVPAGTEITEALGEGQDLRKLVIYDVEINSAKPYNVNKLVYEWELNKDYTIENNSEGDPVIKLLKDKTRIFAIFVAAEASDEVYRYKNVATLAMPDGTELPVEGMVEKSAKDDWLNKDGTQGTGENYRYINWSVTLNKDSHIVHNPRIEDTISTNTQTFVYDSDKNVVVNVYKAKVNDQGGFVKDGPAIDLPEKPTVSIDAVNGTQTLSIKLGDQIDSPYIVEYQTLLDPGIENNEVISNSATLIGEKTEIHQTTKEIQIKSTDGEGTSSGKNGVLKFEKVDNQGEFITTDYALFDLYRLDKDGNESLLLPDIKVLGNKIITDDGEMDQISNLRYGTYVLKESKAPDGYTKDETKHTITISSELVTHTFKVVNNPELSASIQLKAKKDLNGRTLKDKEFSFNLKGAGVDQTVGNDADGNVQFDEILYSEKGKHEYTISEVIPADKEPGMTYDETKYKVTVTVEEKAGKLEATAVYEDVESGNVPIFKNTYKALPTSIKLAAQKELSGRELQDKEFSFNLKGENVDQTVKNNKQGKVEFSAIDYEKAGTYEYTISEVIPATPETGITYDETKYKVTVTVEEKAGKLEATEVYENVEAGKVPLFKNAYKALPTSIKLEAQKELSGRELQGKEFSFNLKGKDVDQTVKNNQQGKVEFSAIDYEKAGTYEYTISEVIPSTPEPGMTYDETKYKVTVTVEEKAGKLEATAVYEDVESGKVPIFKNTYKVLPTSIKLAAQKELSGRTLKDQEFSFTLKGENVDQTVENDEQGKVEFSAIDYEKAGIYEYTISEVIPSTPETGMTYDETKYKVTVTVEEKAGKLEATEVYENVEAGKVPIFKNTYKVLPTSIKLAAQKELSGRELKDEEFSFNLNGKNVDQTVKNNQQGKVEFSAIEYDKAGTYEYTISEVIPATPETGMTYDETKYKVTVTVEEKAGKLEATEVYENVEAGKVPLFKNAYKAMPTSIKLEAQKELSGRELKDEEFSFNLKGKDVDQTVKNNKQGKVEFSAIDYEKAGIYEYTISEVIPSTPETGMTYDETKYKVTVTVEEKAGKLEATEVYENVEAGKVPLFKNAYKALPTSIKLEAQKELSGRELKDKEFSFHLKGKDVDQTVKNDEQGKVEFSAIDYDKAGTYEYTISEVIPADKEPGMTYDETEYKVTVTVEDKAGKLEANAVYEDVETGKVPVFKNTFLLANKLPAKITLAAQKELSGRPLGAGDFSFNLKGENIDQTVQNDEKGNVTFEELSYDTAGTYEYTISEVIPADKEPGMTYDETEYKVVVTVEDTGGKLAAKAEYENIEPGKVPVFKNVYKIAPTSIKLEAQKNLTGRKLKDQEFIFNLKGEGVNQTVKNTADGKIAFAEIDYTKAGIYNYTISEVIPAQKDSTITYDDTEFKVIVKVEERAGKLEANATYSVNDPNSDLPTFKNLYTPEKEVPTGEILLKKVDSKTGKTLANAEFKLVDEKDNLIKEKIVTGEDGTIIIKGLSDGNYKVIETKAPKGYQIDEKPVEFSVKNSQASKKEISKANDRIGLPSTGDSNSTGTTNVQTNTTYRNGAGSSSTAKSLPSTGSTRSTGLIVLGLFFLAMIALVVFGKRKKI